MEIKIEVPEDKFKDVLQEELNAFSKEELHNICRQALISCMSDPEQLNELLKKKDRYYYGDKYELEKLLYEAAKTLDFSPLFKELEGKIIEYVRSNYNTIIRNMVFELLMNGIGSNIFHSTAFQTELTNSLISLQCNINEQIDSKLNR